MSSPGRAEGLEGGAPTPTLSPTLLPPLSPTCLQESSTGRAQEHNGVIVDTGHCHGSQAAVGEDGGGCDGVHDGQRVLEVCSSTVQLLRLQLGRDTNINSLHKHQDVPLPPPSGAVGTAQTSQSPALPS